WCSKRARTASTTSTTARTRTTSRRWSPWTRRPPASAPCSPSPPWSALRSRSPRSSPASARSWRTVAEYSFDVVSEFNPAALTNALDQARREAATRFDFKDTATSYDHRGDVIVIESASEDRARAALQVLREKAARRQLSPKLFKAGDPKTVGKGRGQIEV